MSTKFPNISILKFFEELIIDLATLHSTYVVFNFFFELYLRVRREIFLPLQVI